MIFYQFVILFLLIVYQTTVDRKCTVLMVFFFSLFLICLILKLIKIKSWSPLEVQILWFDNPFYGFQAQKYGFGFSQPQRSLHVRVYSFVVCGFIRCGKNRNSGRYTAISVMVSTVFIYDRPFAFANGGRGKPSV